MSNLMEVYLYIQNVIAMERFRATHPAAAMLTQKYLERCGLWGKDYHKHMTQTFDEFDGNQMSEMPEPMKIPESGTTLDALFDYYPLRRPDEDIDWKVKPLPSKKLKPVAKLEPIKEPKSLEEEINEELDKLSHDKFDDDKGDDDAPSF